METPPTEALPPLPEETGRGLTLKYQGRYLLSSRNPTEHCKKILDQFPREDGTLYLVPSPLFGHHLASWAAGWGPGCHALVLELEDNLKKFIPDLPRDSFSVLDRDSEEAVREFFLHTSPGTFRRVRVVSLTGGTALHQPRYQKVFLRLESEIHTYWQNRSTLMVMAPLYLKNLWKNLRYLESHSACRPWESPKSAGKPTLVLGAGESLEFILPQLPALRDRLFLVAADTALPALRDAGITPDAVVVLESQFHNLADFTGYPWQCTELWTDLTAHPKTFRLPWKSVRYFLSDFAPLSLLARLKEAGIPLLPPRGSVGVTALELALRYTSGSVGVAGLDFCFVPGKTHVRGAPGHQKRLSATCRLASPESPPAEGLTLLQQTSPRLATTQALRQYGESAAFLAQGERHRLWDLRSWGWDLGLRKATPEVFAAMGDAPAEGSTDRGKPQPEEVLAGERLLLSHLWEDFRSMGLTGSLPPGFLDRLHLADYLWCSFPDHHRMDLLSPGALSRIKASLAFHWHHIRPESEEIPSLG